MAPLQKGSKYTNGCVLLFCLVSLIAEDQKILDGEREQNENLTLAKPAAGKKKSSCCGKFSVCPWTGCGRTTASSFGTGGEPGCKDPSRSSWGPPGHSRVRPLWDFHGYELPGHLRLSVIFKELIENRGKKIDPWTSVCCLHRENRF